MLVDTTGDEHDLNQVEWEHLGYYVRREEGELVLVQIVLTRSDDPDEPHADAHTLYIDLNDLEPEWAESVRLQGMHLPEGKSCAFVPPDEEESE